MNIKTILRSGFQKNWEGVVFIAPWFIGFVVFMAFPIG